MVERIKQFVAGVTSGLSQALVISPDRAYVRPSKTPFQADAGNLHSDSRKVTNSLNRKLKQYPHGKSSYQR